MIREKKKYLKNYLIQESKLNRLKIMQKKNPKKKSFYKEKIKNAYYIRSKIEQKIESIEDELLKEILYDKYILGMTLEEVSISINYSKRHTERLHIKALEEIKL